MANALAIRIRKAKEFQAPSAANLAHNSAMTKASYWLNEGANLLQSKSYSNHRELNEDFNSWVNAAKERYSNNPDTKRALRNDAVIIEEGMIIIGSDVAASKEEIHQIILDFAAKFEKDNNTKIKHWSYHDHEGHLDPDGNEQVNRHIHFLFDNVSNDGVMVRRNWKKTYLTQLQDDIHSIANKYLKVERGTKSTYEQVDIIENGEVVRTVNVNTRKNIKHGKFRQDKVKEELSSERAKQKDLNEVINNLRAELQEQKAAREDYKKLEDFKKQLQKEIKAKTLTIAELEKQVNHTFKNGKVKSYKDIAIMLQEENKLLKQKLNEAARKLESISTVKDTIKSEKSVSRPNMSDLNTNKNEREKENERIITRLIGESQKRDRELTHSLSKNYQSDVERFRERRTRRRFYNEEIGRIAAKCEQIRNEANTESKEISELRIDRNRFAALRERFAAVSKKIKGSFAAYRIDYSNLCDKINITNKYLKIKKPDIQDLKNIILDKLQLKKDIKEYELTFSKDMINILKKYEEHIINDSEEDSTRDKNILIDK